MIEPAGRGKARAGHEDGRRRGDSRGDVAGGATAFLAGGLWGGLQPGTARDDDRPVPATRSGEVVPRDVREMYDRGLQYLAKTQTEQGDWQGGQQGPGITGMALMVFLASGEDPNFGPYSNNVRKALRSIINSQDAQTGIMGNAMYHHGFATLGLAEAYGAVDERNLWPERQGTAVDRPGARAGRPRRDHLAEEEPQRRLALLARRAATPIPRSAARSSSGCSPPATPASRSPTSRSTRRSPITPR